jgi:hypothetical protein
MLPADQTPKMLAMQHWRGIPRAGYDFVSANVSVRYDAATSRRGFHTSVHVAKPNPHELVMLNLHRFDARGTRGDFQRR